MRLRALIKRFLIYYLLGILIYPIFRFLVVGGIFYYFWRLFRRRGDVIDDWISGRRRWLWWR